jgi:hypothetical protein
VARRGLTSFELRGDGGEFTQIRNFMVIVCGRNRMLAGAAAFASFQFLNA